MTPHHNADPDPLAMRSPRRLRPAKPTTTAPRGGVGRWAWGGAVLGALCTTLVFAPARWLAQALEEATAGHVLLTQPRGTVWNGSASLALSGGERSQDLALLPGRVSWRLRTTWRGLELALNADCCTAAPLQGVLTPGWGRLTATLADSRSQWPAGLLVGLGTPWNTVQAQGLLQLHTTALQAEWAAGRLRLGGQARLQAQDVSSRLSTLHPMGSYELVLTGGDTPELTLSTLQGSLKLQGQGRWVGQRLHFEGTAEAAPDREAALSNLLNIIGRRSGARSLITL